MAHVFFSYASEDKATVGAIFDALLKAHPEHRPWVDKYEIVGGESLLDRIAEGMDAAQKFFIFLSPISAEKPWVKAELKRAIMREIEGVDPAYIVPVKVGDLKTIPPFLEGKRYINLGKLTQEEWLTEFDAAITGVPPQPGSDGSENLSLYVERGSEGAHIALVHFIPKAWAEKLSFFVQTNKDMVEPEDTGPGAVMDMLDFGDAATVTLALHGAQWQRTRRLSALASQDEVRPGERVTFRLVFPEGVDAGQMIQAAGRWEVS